MSVQITTRCGVHMLITVITEVLQFCLPARFCLMPLRPVQVVAVLFPTRLTAKKRQGSRPVKKRGNTGAYITRAKKQTKLILDFLDR